MKPWGSQARGSAFLLVVVFVLRRRRPPSGTHSTIRDHALVGSAGRSHSFDTPRRPLVRPPSGDTEVSHAGTPSYGLTRLAPRGRSAGAAVGRSGRRRLGVGPPGLAVAEHGPE